LIAVLLSFFNEDERLLAEAVESVAWAGRLLAADGRYELLQAPRYLSPRSQREAIVRRAAEVGLRCEVVTPSRPWRDEVTKRSLLFRLAHERGAGWAMQLDADERVVEVDVPGLRRLLATTSADALTIRMEQRLDVESAWRTRRVFRVTPGLHVAHAHYEIRDGTRRLAGAEDRLPALERCEHAPIVVRHRRDERTLARRRAQAAYYRKRDAAGIERL
jgi:hypothetical protein